MAYDSFLFVKKPHRSWLLKSGFVVFVVYYIRKKFTVEKIDFKITEKIIFGYCIEINETTMFQN
jgi:hypothetical protein